MMTTDDAQIISIRAEQAVIGSLLRDNDAMDRISDLDATHFYRHDHRLIFTEIKRQIVAGKRADAITLFEKLSAQVEDCLSYFGQLQSSAVSAANIKRHAEIIVDSADKRALVAIGLEMQELGSSHQSASTCIDLMASKLEALAQKKSDNEPERMDSMLGPYLEFLEQRMAGNVKPVATGFRDLDTMLDGGFDRGTLTVIAGRPGMGKTAAGLGICRNASESGTALFLSMEMARNQVNDRNIAALGRIPIKWLRKPGQDENPDSQDTRYWNAMTHAIQKAQQMGMWIDDQTGLNMVEIRAKARKVKRKAGLDLIVVDQLSFITGGQSEKDYAVIGEHTRGLVALAKELDCAVILLCQLNRECEKRPNKRPMQSDLAMSGSIEQDAANIIFLYRDEVYNADTREKGICEWISVKQRQGEPATVALNYVGSQTRFEDLPYPWRQHVEEEKPKRSGGLS
jgi:replicative DNA helicase